MNTSLIQQLCEDTEHCVMEVLRDIPIDSIEVNRRLNDVVTIRLNTYHYIRQLLKVPNQAANAYLELELEGKVS